MNVILDDHFTGRLIRPLDATPQWDPPIETLSLDQLKTEALLECLTGVTIMWRILFDTWEEKEYSAYRHNTCVQLQDALLRAMLREEAVTKVE